MKSGYLRELAGGQYLIEVKGWEQLQPTAGIPGKCFIAMSFHESLKDAYEQGIYLAVKEDCRMDPVRIDLVPTMTILLTRLLLKFGPASSWWRILPVTEEGFNSKLDSQRD